MAISLKNGEEQISPRRTEMESPIQEAEGSFGPNTKRKTVEEFVVAYYNGSIKPNLSEKDAMTGRDAEYLMDAPQFDKVDRSEVWSYSAATGSGYQYRVVYKDKRFSRLAQLAGMYSGSIPVTDEDKPMVEQRLYEMILALIRERRLPPTFKLQTAKETRPDGSGAEVARLAQALESLERRVMALEEAGQKPA